ncbi:response regulator [Hymenobacter sp. BT491]|uniref:response regulator n=1 Tax=Hymenobacter sp. BT491 TaxID=2766779 RepID=UPI0016537F4F|nr:response regulator transcription factor [Hymenobacter sp. BT491]MBC6991090.1 response regulator transcription factor [Hymenobacter sp. BT491]
MIRVVLADDHTILRDGVKALLNEEPDLQTVGEANHGRELLELLADTPTDVVVMDIHMPVMDGFATVTELRALHPEVRILILSMLDHENYVNRMLEAGALGYVLKSADISEISFGIRMVAAGRPFICTHLGLSLLQRIMQSSTSLSAYQTGNAGSSQRPNDLSKRELEVLKLIAEGLTNAEIADKLFTSKRTVETHRQNIIEKTQAKNTAALIKFAVSNGLLE